MSLEINKFSSCPKSSGSVIILLICLCFTFPLINKFIYLHNLLFNYNNAGSISLLIPKMFSFQINYNLLNIN